MMHNIAGHKTNTPLAINSLAGADNIVITGQPGKAIFIYELIGDLTSNSTLLVKSGAVDILASFNLKAGQGITATATPELEGEPRFVCKPGDNFVLNFGAATSFNGNVYWAFRE